jgi:hypothetical protein
MKDGNGEAGGWREEQANHGEGSPSNCPGLESSWSFSGPMNFYGKGQKGSAGCW